MEVILTRHTFRIFFIFLFFFYFLIIFLYSRVSSPTPQPNHAVILFFKPNQIHLCHRSFHYRFLVLCKVSNPIEHHSLLRTQLIVTILIPEHWIGCRCVYKYTVTQKNIQEESKLGFSKINNFKSFENY